MDFLEASYSELEARTGIPSCNWSLYFNKKKGITTHTLDRIAKALNTDSCEVLRLIHERQRILLIKKQSEKLAS